VAVLPLPTYRHADYAILAMQAGCHVFTEKPMALTVADCDRMLRARDRHRRQLLVGQVLRFWPEYEALRQTIERRTYGRLMSLTMERNGAYASWAKDNWFNNHRLSGGAILDLHLHDVDWAVYALGLPASVQAAGRVGQTGGIDDVSALWDYKGGPLVTMRGTWLYTGFAMNFRALFEKATLECGFSPDPGLRLLKGGKKPVKIKVPAANGYYQELRYLFDCVAGRKTNTICPGESTRESVRLVWVEKQAIAKGKGINPKRA
jgi:predicted dehydrogenase